MLVIPTCLVSVHVAVPPRITSQLKSAIQGKFVKFTVEATGTTPLNYQWQWKPAEEGWQPCDAEWCNGATLTIPNTKKSNEGSYRCVVSNYVGNQTSIPAELCVSKYLTIVPSTATVVTMNCLSLPHHMPVFLHT